MRIYLTLLLVLPLAMLTSQQTVAAPPPGFDDGFDEPEPPSNIDLTVSLLSNLINSPKVQSKIRTFYELKDLEVRFWRITRSVFTRPNLILFRNILDWISRACNFVMRFLPDEPQEETRQSGGFFSNFFPALGFQNSVAETATEASNDVDAGLPARNKRLSMVADLKNEENQKELPSLLRLLQQ